MEVYRIVLETKRPMPVDGEIFRASDIASLRHIEEGDEIYILRSYGPFYEKDLNRISLIHGDTIYLSITEVTEEEYKASSRFPDREGIL